MIELKQERRLKMGWCLFGIILLIIPTVQVSAQEDKIPVSVIQEIMDYNNLIESVLKMQLLTANDTLTVYPNPQIKNIEQLQFNSIPVKVVGMNKADTTVVHTFLYFSITPKREQYRVNLSIHTPTKTVGSCGFKEFVGLSTQIKQRRSKWKIKYEKVKCGRSTGMWL